LATFPEAQISVPYRATGKGGSRGAAPVSCGRCCTSRLSGRRRSSRRRR